jgi:hypothetical protein
LENDLNLFSERAELALSQLAKIVAMIEDLTLGGIDQSEDASGHRRFSAPAFSHQPKRLPPAKIKFNTIYGPNISSGFREQGSSDPEVLLEVFHFQDSFMLNVTLL